MKQKVINITYRKDSETFPKWMKYEIEILNEDGTIEKIPAYGKDLEHALQRVVRDKKMKKVEKTPKVPMTIWLLLWFIYLGTLSIVYMESQSPMMFMGGILGAVAVILSLNWWARPYAKR